MVYILAEAEKERSRVRAGSGGERKAEGEGEGEGRTHLPSRGRQQTGRGRDRRDCIFCDMPAEGEERFRDNLILSCAERCFIVLNRYPYNNGHLMVVPRRHVPDPAELDQRDYQLLTELLRRTTTALCDAVHPHGVNLGMNLGRTAGAGIDRHCHFHLVPRWDGDTNFMPVVGGAKVISEDLWATWDRLRPLMCDLALQVEEELG
jgi:ATP adenylyltransferase